MAKEAKKQDPQQQLEALFNKLVKQHSEFTQPLVELPGSAGRLLKQVRDIEQVAPLFRDAGLVKAVPKPTIVNLRVAGIATKSCLDKVLGGFIYASAAVRTDLLIDDNKVSTVGSDSVSELDDIDFEAQRKRLDLIEIRQAYQLV